MENQNKNPQQAIAEKIKDCKNILVTVSSNPSVDQLAACLGLTLWLNKVDKHATAVFSGEVPSTLEFLQPAETLEKNTDSLRDFIISLDKSKADKLRYKVEDSVVKVFVTPYRTSLSADDLEFSQGDFNVDMVIALGVHRQDELDTAITAHGRILHDATVATITIGDTASELGSISWHDVQASSLSELVVELANGVDQLKIDNQIATALLTGVVAETARFSNEKTTPQTMSISAQLMSAGANQQLVATKLDEPAPQPETPPEIEPEPTAEEPITEVAAPEQPTVNDDGTIAIDHEHELEEPTPGPEPEAESEAEPEATDEPADEPEAPKPEYVAGQEPELGGTLTANTEPDNIMDEPTVDPMSQPEPQPPLMSHDDSPADNLQPPVQEPFQPPPADWLPPEPWMAPAPAAASAAPVAGPLPGPTVADNPPTGDDRDITSARDEVMKAINDAPEPAAPEPVQALNALPIDLNPPVPAPEPTPAAPIEPIVAPEPVQPFPVPTTAFDPSAFGIMNDPETLAPPPPPPAAAPLPADDPDLTGPVEQPYTLPLPNSLTPPAPNPVPPTSLPFDPTAPPPVPPPMPFGKQ